MKYLRSLKYSDLQFLEEIENNPQYMKFGDHHLPFTKKQLEKFISNSHLTIHEADQFRYVIDFEEKAVGFLDLFAYNANEHAAFVGIILVPPQRRLGLAYLSLLELETICLRDWNISILKAQVAVSNVPSINLFEKLSYKRVGITAESDISSFYEPLITFEKTLYEL